MPLIEPWWMKIFHIEDGRCACEIGTQSMDALECNMLGIEEILCILDEYTIITKHLYHKAALQTFEGRTTKKCPTKL
jgi:hypothetical protein